MIITLALLSCTGFIRAEQILPIKKIGGRVVVPCTLRAKGQDIPAHLLVDIGNPNILTLHGNTAKLFELSKQTRVDVVWKGGSFDAILPRHYDNPDLETFSKDNSAALDEIPVVGIIGFAAFENQIVQIDLEAGRIRFARPEDDGRALFPQASESIIIVDYELARSGPSLAGKFKETKNLKIQLATVRHESVLNSEWVKNPANEKDLLGLFKFAGMDISLRSPLRIYEFDALGGTPPDVLLGTSFLNSSVWTFDTVTRKVAVEIRPNPVIVPAEQAYFLALYNQNADGIESYIQNSGDVGQYVREAASTLLNWRLAQKPFSQDAASRAVDSYAKTMSAEKRSARMVELSDQLANGENQYHWLLAEYALRRAQKDVQTDLNSSAAHQINARLGRLALKQEKYQDARRLLLSAAFGLPRDPNINLWLGQMYWKTGQLTRAWSRYIEVALMDHPPADAWIALDELYRQPEFRKHVRISDIQTMLEGRVPSFVPFQESSPDTKSPIRLIEFFADIDKPSSLGAELAVHALPAYFGESEVVALQYPLGRVLVSDAAQKRAVYYGLSHVSSAVVMDGAVVAKEGGGEETASGIFENYLHDAGRQTPAESIVRIQSQAELNDNTIRVDIRLHANGMQMKNNLHLHVLLCEKMVFAYSGNKSFLHRNIVRASLTPADGMAISADMLDKNSLFNISLLEVNKRLDETWIAAGDNKIKWRMRPTLVDPDECEIVAFIQDGTTRKMIYSQRSLIHRKEKP